MMSWIKAQRGEVSAALAGDAGDEGCLVVRGGHGDLGSSGKGERANETRPRVWMIYADRVNPGQVCESTLGQNTALRLTGYSAAAGGLAGWRAGGLARRSPGFLATPVATSCTVGALGLLQLVPTGGSARTRQLRTTSHTSWESPMGPRSGRRPSDGWLSFCPTMPRHGSWICSQSDSPDQCLARRKKQYHPSAKSLLHEPRRSGLCASFRCASCTLTRGENSITQLQVGIFV